MIGMIEKETGVVIATSFLVSDFSCSEKGVSLRNRAWAWATPETVAFSNVGDLPSDYADECYRFADGAWSIADQDRLDAINAERQTAAMMERAAACKAECARRIYEVADQPTQTNLASRAPFYSGDELTIYKAGIDWIADMQTTARALVMDPATDYLADENWPAVPAGVQEMADRY